MAVKKTSEKTIKKKTLSAKERHQKKLEALAKLEAMEPEEKKVKMDAPTEKTEEKEEPKIAPSEATEFQAQEAKSEDESIPHTVSDTVQSEKTSTEGTDIPTQVTEEAPLNDEKVEEVLQTPVATDTDIKPTSPYTEQMQQLGSLKTVALQTDEGGSKKKFLLIVLAIILLTFAGLGGAYFYMETSTQTKPATKKTEVTKAPSPTPTVEPTPDLASATIEVQNGSGISGEAARLQEVLEEAGFTVGSVGNADNSDYTQTVIQAKKTVSETVVKQLTDTLKASYGLAETEELAESESSDIIVIIGSEKAAN